MDQSVGVGRHSQRFENLFLIVGGDVEKDAIVVGALVNLELTDPGLAQLFSDTLRDFALAVGAPLDSGEVVCSPQTS